MTNQELFEVAEQVCTPRQLEVVAWRRRGASWRQIAIILDISHTTARDHFKAACDRIIAAVECPSDPSVTVEESRVVALTRTHSSALGAPSINKSAA